MVKLVTQVAHGHVHFTQANPLVKNSGWQMEHYEGELHTAQCEIHIIEDLAVAISALFRHLL